MSKIILTDVDDTVLKFADPFQDWAHLKGYESNGRIRDIYSVENCLSLTPDQAIELMTEFSLSAEMVLQPPERCALDVLPMLYRQGYRFIAITACGMDARFRDQRMRTLESTFGFKWEDIHVVDLRAHKRDVLKRFDPTIWVEDNFAHAVDGAAIGHKSYLLERSYNSEQHHPEVIKVKDWHGIAAHLEQSDV